MLAQGAIDRVLDHYKIADEPCPLDRVKDRTFRGVLRVLISAIQARINR